MNTSEQSNSELPPPAWKLTTNKQFFLFLNNLIFINKNPSTFQNGSVAFVLKADDHNFKQKYSSMDFTTRNRAILTLLS